MQMSRCANLLVLLAYLAPMPSVAAELSPEAQQVINALTPKLAHAAQYGNTSFSIGIATHSEHYGIAVGLDRHLDPPRRMTDETLIPSGSVAKTYTSAYAMHLHEHGVLDIDAPAATYADRFLRRTNGTTLYDLWGGGANGKVAASVTSRQLMSMRSGMQDYDDGKLRAYSLDPDTWPNDIEPLQFSPKYAVDGWTGDAFLYAPDQGGSYSSVGYVVLGWVLAGATNATSWEDLDQRAFFPAPVRAALPGFQFFPPGACSAALPNVSHQYAFQSSQRESPYWNTLDFVDLWPSSCLNGWTCGNSAMAPKDLAAALYALLGARRNETLWGNETVKPAVSDAGLAQMQHFQPLTTGWSTGMEYGLGLMVNRFNWDGVAPQYTTWVGHGGLDYGSGAVWHFYNAALDVAVVISRNTQGGGMNCSLIQTHNGQGRNFDEGAFEGCVVQQVLKTYSTNSTAFPGPVQPCSRDPAVQSLSDPPYAAVAERGDPTSEGASKRRGTRGLAPRPAVHAKRTGNFAASNLGYVPTYCPSHDCTGVSSALQPAECAAWKQLHATLNGQYWKDERCAASFTDPCGAPDYCLRCSGDGAHITAIELRNMSLIGDLGAAGSALGALTQLTSLDVSTNTLFGTVPTALRSLTALRAVRLDSNMLSGTLPELHWGASIAQTTCGLGDNDFDCPLPQSASNCMAGAGAPACDDITASSSPYAQSAKCIAARSAMQKNLKVDVALARVQSFVGTLAGAACSTCGNEIAQNSSCHATLDWDGNAAAAAAAQKLRDAVSAVSTSAQVCFSNVQKYQVSNGKWIELVIEHLSPIVFAADCNTTENQKWLDYINRPSQCVKLDQGWRCSASCD